MQGFTKEVLGNFSNGNFIVIWLWIAKEKAHEPTDNSLINSLIFLCPCFSAILAGTSPSILVILQALVASGCLSRTAVRFFNPNLAAQ